MAKKQPVDTTAPDDLVSQLEAAGKATKVDVTKDIDGEEIVEAPAAPEAQPDAPKPPPPAQPKPPKVANLGVQKFADRQPVYTKHPAAPEGTIIIHH